MRTDARTRADALVVAVIGVSLSYVWRIQDVIPIMGTLQFTSIISLLAIGLYVIDRDPRRSLRTLAHPITKIVCFLGVLTILSVPTSVHDGASFRFLTQDLWKNLLLTFVLAGSVRSFVDIERYGLGILLGGIFYAQHAYFKGFIGHDGRLAGMAYYDANDVGMVMVGMMPLSIYFIARGKSLLARGLALLGLPLFLQVTILTGSRGAFLGMISVGLYFLFRFGSISSARRVFIVFSAVAVVLVAGSESYWEMMNSLLHPQDDYNWSGQSETGRMEIWKRGMGYMLTHPLTGVGVNAFPMAEGMLSPFAKLQEVGVGFKWSAAHNSFVQIGAELGIFGLIGFVLLLLRCYRTARSVAPPRRPGERPTDLEVLGHAFAGVVVAYVVTGFFLSQAYGAYAFAIYGLVLGIAKVAMSGQTTASTNRVRQQSQRSAHTLRRA